MSSLESLRLVRTADDLAGWLEVDVTTLQEILGTNPGAQYRTFAIRKRGGGFRRIDAPSGPLKAIQQKIGRALQGALPASPVACGYQLGKSIYDHASPHRSAEWTLTIDLEGFFPSIDAQRLQIALQQVVKLDADCIPLILALCMKEGLPQGAPTSPVLSNLACVEFDEELQALAKKLGFTITRYADDICISSPAQDLPSELVGFDGVRIQPGGVLRELIERNGYRINDRKTRYSNRSRPHLVTGLVVGDRVDMPRQWKRQLRVLERLLAVHGEKVGSAILSDWEAANLGSKRPRSISSVIAGKRGFRNYLVKRSLTEISSDRER